MNRKTYQPKKKDVKRNWHLMDAKEKILGRFATEVVRVLMGKHKENYSSHMDMGDYVVVTNVKDVKVTGNKESQKTYIRHSGYPGGFKEVAYQKLLNESPEKILIHAVSGMLPDNRLKKKRLVRLKIFSGGEHTFKDKFKQ